MNYFLLEKVVDGEAAWKTTLIWVLSGPTRRGKQLNVDKSKIASVSFVQADIQRLWELEEMPGQHHSDLSCFFNFPVKRKDGSYDVGLLWKGNQRPCDNYDQAVHRLESLL